MGSCGYIIVLMCDVAVSRLWIICEEKRKRRNRRRKYYTNQIDTSISKIDKASMNPMLKATR